MPTPDNADAKAAHQFLTELRTRISTQPLPYQYGTDARALESLWELFAHARTAIKAHPGCEVFARTTSDMLNQAVRPITAKWHRAHVQGVLDTRDGADAFRGELCELQVTLRAFASDLHLMAYGTAATLALAPPAISAAQIASYFTPIAYGIPAGWCGDTPDTTRAEINAAECGDIEKRRAQRVLHSTSGSNAIGLALSGGGIRSAAFSLGVVQVLIDKQLLREVDFLSTVSGGDYTGSFLSSWLGAQATGGGHDDALLGKPHGPDPEPIRHLRQRAKYLAAQGVKQSWARVTAGLAGLLANWTIPLLVLVIAAMMPTAAAAWFPDLHLPHLVGAIGLVATAILGLYIFSIRSTTWSPRFGVGLGWLSATFALLLLLWGIDVLYAELAGLRPLVWNRAGHYLSLSGFLSLAVIAVPTVLRFVPWLEVQRVRTVALRTAMVLAGVIVPLLGLAVYFALRMVADNFGVQPLVIGAAVLVVYAFISVDINLTSPHRLYRNGLSRTFVQRDDSDAKPLLLTDLNSSGAAPYHLLNAALNLPGSDSSALRERRCDFFLFSKHWSGAPSIGYRATKDWRMSGAPADLASAMAISGAAVSPFMGLGSMPSLTALLSFLNVRLSYWIKHPSQYSLWKHPGFLCLLSEMTGAYMTEREPWLNLSDGGHIENLGVYELLRRRCKFIICVDGEADPEFRFQGLMTLVRHAQIDFGIRLDPRLDELRLDPATRQSRAHAHLCLVEYPSVGIGSAATPAATGLLLYLKLSVTGNESELIRRYRLNNPDFPHETTLDQFFSEEQFEAYRQLGVHVAEGMFTPALMASGQRANGAVPSSIEDWFRRMSANLLRPM